MKRLSLLICFFFFFYLTAEENDNRGLKKTLFNNRIWEADEQQPEEKIKPKEIETEPQKETPDNSHFQVKEQAIPETTPAPEPKIINKKVIPFITLAEKSVTEKNLEWFRQLGQYAKKHQPGSNNLAKARNVINILDRVAQWQEGNKYTKDAFYANTNHLGRFSFLPPVPDLKTGTVYFQSEKKSKTLKEKIDNIIDANMGRGTCGWWREHLLRSFTAAGINIQDIYKAESSVSSPDELKAFVDDKMPNSVHTALLVVNEDEKLYVFDPWYHGHNKGMLWGGSGIKSIAGVGKSKFNGMLFKDWYHIQHSSSRGTLELETLVAGSDDLQTQKAKYAMARAKFDLKIWRERYGNISTPVDWLTRELWEMIKSKSSIKKTLIDQLFQNQIQFLNKVIILPKTKIAGNILDFETRPLGLEPVFKNKVIQFAASVMIPKTEIRLDHRLKWQLFDPGGSLVLEKKAPTPYFEADFKEPNARPFLAKFKIDLAKLDRNKPGIDQGKYTLLLIQEFPKNFFPKSDKAKIQFRVFALTAEPAPSKEISRETTTETQHSDPGAETETTVNKKPSQKPHSEAIIPNPKPPPSTATVTKPTAKPTPAPPKQKLKISVKPVVKPGEMFKFEVIYPPHYKNPQIEEITYTNNLDTLDGTPLPKKRIGHLIADNLVTRMEKAHLTVDVRDRDTPGVFESASAKIIINAYTKEEKIELHIAGKMLSGRTYNFQISVPQHFKRPLSVHVKSSLGKHLKVFSTTTSLNGSVKAWGNGDPNVILTGKVSATVYDDKTKTGYVEKMVQIDEPTPEDLNKIPMEQPPTWYEEAVKFTWDVTKKTVETTGEVLNTTGQVMNAIGQAEAKHGYLGKALQQQQNKATQSSESNYLKPADTTPKPKQPDWMNPQKTKSSKPSTSGLQKTYYIVKSVTKDLKKNKTNIGFAIFDKKPRYPVQWVGNWAKLTQTVVYTAQSYEEANKVHKQRFYPQSKKEWQPDFITFKPK